MTNEEIIKENLDTRITFRLKYKTSKELQKLAKDSKVKLSTYNRSVLEASVN